MADEVHPPSDPVVLAALIAKDPGLSEVQDMDRPMTAPRLVRLDPYAASRWCYATDMGHYDTNNTPTPVSHSGGWVCGRWFARPAIPKRK